MPGHPSLSRNLGGPHFLGPEGIHWGKRLCGGLGGGPMVSTLEEKGDLG